MTSLARFFGSLALFGLAVIFGLVSGAVAASTAEGRLQTVAPLSFPSGERNTAGLVARIVEAGLFPDAELGDRSPTAGTSPGQAPSLRQLADALEAATPAAFVDGASGWFVVLPDPQSAGFLRLGRGDMLQDAWRVSDIDATSIVVQREGGSRRLSAYGTVDSGDAE